MAKKKNTEETVFDVESAINELEIPSMLKTGFKFYLTNNNITIQSANDLDKKLKQFKEMNAGA